MQLTTDRIDPTHTTGRAEGVARRQRFRRFRTAATATLVATTLLAGGVAAALVVAGAIPGGAGERPGEQQASTGMFGTALDPDDGFVEPGGAVSPFADDLPAIARLEPALRAAMQEAARAAIADGVEFVVTSGWRSAAYQQWLFDEAVSEYGSVDVARQFVLSPEASKHVSGEAVDIGRTDANSWLSQHGSAYGLCQIYANEMWHFELATSPGGQCPAQLADGTAG